MKRALQVCLGDEGRPVGDPRYDRQGAREHAAFTYDATWLAAPNGFALERFAQAFEHSERAAAREASG